MTIPVSTVLSRTGYGGLVRGRRRGHAVETTHGRVPGEGPDVVDSVTMVAEATITL
ncbi:hypothetical protein L5G33_16745 [Gordonia sp. HY366]|uniref:Uncharacterized protein n=1 Tax=Gordonia liuliyuniae TaxID=2911517 RepID=A0ABS9IX11_9ACTN|nr:hypothetical protein [Gordonia liuliyuniae]